MKRYLRYLLRSSLLLLACLFLYSVAFGWGYWAHKEIHRQAIKCLPQPLFDFFIANERIIVEESIAPDERRSKDPEEAFYHYLDLDRYGKYPFPELPRDYGEAAKKFGADSVKKNGLLPWRIAEMTEKLSDAMRRGRKKEILRYAADLGHYIADAHVPLHTTENYDGQLTGQVGIHSRFESHLPEMFGKQYRFSCDSVRFLTDPLDHAFNIILRSFTLVDSVLQADVKAKRGLREQDLYVVTRRNGRIEYRYSDGYFKRFNKFLNGLPERRMQDAIHSIADFWYTAWVNAGQPVLSK